MTYDDDYYEKAEDMINEAVRLYINGAKLGRSCKMAPAFHEDATIFGYIGQDLFAGPIQKLFDWIDENEPGTEIEYEIEYMNIEKTIANVCIEIDNWTGNKYTDYFQLLNVDGTWKIMNKIFHLHA